MTERCRVTEETNAYYARMEKAERQQAEIDLAKIAALLTILRRGQHAVEHTGLELVSEALSEHDLIVYRTIIALLEAALDGADTLEDAWADLDDAALGRAVKDIMTPYLESVAESRYEDHLVTEEDRLADTADMRIDEMKERACTSEG